MKQILLFCIAMFSAFSIYSQGVFLNFSSSLQICPYDSTQTNLMYDDWEVYKTLDNTWNGTIDSSFCATLSLPYNYLDLTNLVVGETVFIRHKFTDSTKILLQENTLYSTAVYGSSSSNFTNLSVNCPNDMCTGVFLGIDIPDSARTGRDLRWYQAAPDSLDMAWHGDFNTHFCSPTEYFYQNNYLREAIVKLTMGNNGGQEFDLNTFCVVDNNSIGWTQQIKDSLEIYYNPWSNNYQYDIYDATIILYGDTMNYPNIFAMDYVDILPVPNVDTVVTMNIMVDSWGGSLVFQPFTQFQGGYVLNDSTQRHHYNLVNNGGNLCFSMVIDKIFTGGDNYIHNDGTVAFNGKQACLEFNEGSALIVGDSTTLYYGENGIGNLAIGSRGTIKIGNAAELNINNNVVLHRFAYDDETKQQIYMTLNAGSKLTFGGNARIHNNKYYDTPVKLNIYMKGGTVNMSGLDADSRSLVNLIYEKATPNFNENIKILGNPVSDNLRFSITSDYVSDVTIDLFTIDGKRVLNEFQFINKGINYIETDVSNLPNGLYFLHLQSEMGTFTDKVLIMR
jgi:hypothetical protein